MANEDITETVRERIQTLVEGRRGSQRQLAELLGVSASNVTKMLKREDLTIRFVDAVSCVFNVPIGELVAPTGSTIKQLDPDEAAVLRYLRLWPTTVRHALLAFLAFFANEPPAAGQSRRMFEVWRHLDERAKLAVYGFAVDKSQGTLPLDLEAQLFENLSAESKAALERSRKGQRHR